MIEKNWTSCFHSLSSFSFSSAYPFDMIKIAQDSPISRIHTHLHAYQYRIQSDAFGKKKDEREFLWLELCIDVNWSSQSKIDRNKWTRDINYTLNVNLIWNLCVIWKIKVFQLAIRYSSWGQANLSWINLISDRSIYKSQTRQNLISVAQLRSLVYFNIFKWTCTTV